MNPPDNDQNSISRRDFVRTAALAATAVSSGLGLANTAKGQAAGASAASAPLQPIAGGFKPMIGFQAEVPYIIEYGVARFLDDVQTRANVNTLFLHAELFQPSKSPAGQFSTPHPQYYRDIYMKAQAAAAGEFNLPDAMDKITTESKKRGVQTFAWVVEDNRTPPKIDGFDKLYEIDLQGKRTGGHPGGPCLNNPYFRNLISSQVEDLVRGYNVDGLQRGSERQGPLGNALGAWHHGSVSDPSHTSCFCEYCTAKAQKQGIDVPRVRKAFEALVPYVKNGRAGIRPRDGYYVEFWRLLLRYPELLTWENFWADSMREMQREFYAKAKSLRPEVLVGFHVWHNASFNPIYRAEQDYQPYTEYSDFLKPVIYDNPAAERMASYVYSVGQNIYGDLTRQQLLDFEYAITGLTKEKSYAEIINQPQEAYESQLRQLPINGTPRGNFAMFSSDYVYQETKRAVAGVTGSKTKIWPGVGIDVVTKNSTPESVRNVVNAVFQAGGTGMVLSTSHAAMQPQNLSAVGATLRELKLA